MEELTSLIERTRSGDLDAYTGIVRRFQDMAVGYAYTILGDFHLAEDAAQEAFVGAYLDLSNLREVVAFPGWFRRIVYTRCLKMTRRKHVATTVLEDARQVVTDDLDPAGVAEEQELKDQILSAIHSLPDTEREVITLFYMNELSHNEVASFLEVPLTTVNSRLYQSRKRLKKELFTVAQENLKMHKPSKDQVFSAKVRDHLSAMESLHGAYSSLLSKVLSEATGEAIKVNIVSVTKSNLSGFHADLSRPCCVFTFLMQQEDDPTAEKAPMAVSLSIPLAAAVADRRESPPSDVIVVDGRDKTWTSADREKLSRVAIRMLADIERVLKVKVSDGQSETAPEYVLFNEYARDEGAIHVLPDDPAVSILFEAESEETVGQVQICYPFATLDASGQAPASH